MGLEALEQAIAKDEAEAEKRDPEPRRTTLTKRRANRDALPAHLHDEIEVTRWSERHLGTRALLPGADDGDRRGHLGTTGCDPGADPA